MNYEIKLDLTKIDKSKLFKSDKTGAIYLDAFALDSKSNEYGQSHMVVQSTTAEERKAGVKGAILGNLKASEPQKKESGTIDEVDDLPF